ncbi:uncharacterized protein LOC123542265 [Mercenaria mercenaria]|uniref:uncharacterized protein LOC123542265 n=1 Tax=Mercenaria mercenaria TaxID=6596 RepID=UPI00234E6BB5|nr:uncharacterized protein LOC123542265 [Mercenaria mercenaria]
MYASTAEENKDIDIAPDDASDKLNENKEDKMNYEAHTFDFTERSCRTGDFILNVEGTKLHVAKIILSLASPVFDRMFQSEFKESSSEELSLPGKNLEDVKEFLRCIYPNCLVQVSYDNALRLLPLVDEYQVLHLKSRCEHVLVENVNDETSVEELYQRLNEVDMYKLNDLPEKCITLALRKPHDVLIDAKRTCRPPSEDLVEIFEKVTFKMTEIQKQIELKNEELSREIEILRDDAELGKQVKESDASNIKLSEEYDVSMAYITAEIKKSKEVAFEENVKWKETHVVLMAPVAKQYSTSIEKEIWDVPIQISTSVRTETEYSRRIGCYIETCNWFHIKIKHSGKGHISCKVNARCDLVNRQPVGENISVSKKSYFNEGMREQCIDVKRINDINSVSAGFIRDGKIGVIVHLYMTEPNKG